MESDVIFETGAAEANGPGGPKSYLDFQKVVLELSSHLRTLARHAQTLGIKFEQIDMVLKRLEENRFSVAVVGEFKRGKSTFINALLGADLLPTDVLPCSATLNRVVYSVEKRVVIEYKDGHRDEIDFDRLSNYVTKMTAESDALAKTVKEATVYYPNNYCQNNVEVIDTPGLNDDENMTAVTLSILPQVDAAIMIISAQSPFSKFESDFLESRLLTNDLGRVIFVVNAIDRCNSTDEAERLINGIASRLKVNVLDRARKQFGEGTEEYRVYLRKIGSPKVFGLSAYQAVEAKKANDPALLERSGFPIFEQKLQVFLSEYRGAVTLQVPLNRVLTTAGELREALASRKAALQLKAEDFEHAAAESEAEVEALRRRKVEELAALDKAGAVLLDDVGVLGENFVVDIRHAVLNVIDNAEIDSSDLSGTQARDTFNQKLQKQIEVSVAQVTDTYAQKFQQRIETMVHREIERLDDYHTALGGLMKSITSRFIGRTGDASPTTSSGEAAAAAIAVVTGFGGIWGGYKSAGWKGAGVGAAASVGTLAIGGMAVAALAIPITLPVVAVIAVASFFTGRWASNALFKESRITNFRSKIRENAIKNIDEQFSSEDLKEKFRMSAKEAFHIFRSHISDEIESTLENARGTLSYLRQERAKGMAETESDRQALERMATEIDTIANHASRLAELFLEAKEI